MSQSIFTKLLAELQTTKNHNQSIERCKEIIKKLEEKLNKRILSYFASEIGTNNVSMINDEDVFIIENLLSLQSSKKDLVLIIHSNGGYALSAERIIEVCRNYCKRAGDNSQFIVIVPKKAKSAATIIALGADRIYLRDTAELGPIDPQFIVEDKDGNMNIEPAYLYVDALENIFSAENKNLLFSLPDEAKLKLLDQCNYPMYVNAKNELGLSDSIIGKIIKKKISENPKISYSDFDIFRDPHITKSHGRLINLPDLFENSLYKEKIIQRLKKLFGKSEQIYKEVESLLWELYVRKRQLLNDTGNQIVKTIETVEEFFINLGAKKGQIKRVDK